MIEYVHIALDSLSHTMYIISLSWAVHQDLEKGQNKQLNDFQWEPNSWLHIAGEALGGALPNWSLDLVKGML